MDDLKAMSPGHKERFLVELKALLDSWFPPGYIVFETDTLFDDTGSQTGLRSTVMAQEALTESTMTITLS